MIVNWLKEFQPPMFENSEFSIYIKGDYTMGKLLLLISDFFVPSEDFWVTFFKVT